MTDGTFSLVDARGRKYLTSPNSLPRRDVTARDRWRADPLGLSG